MIKNASSIDGSSEAMSCSDVSNASATSAGDRQEDRALVLLSVLANEDGQSLPRLAKRLGLAASELQRLLVVLGDDPQFGGLGLVEARCDSRGRNCIWLTTRGQTICDSILSEDMSPEGILSDGMRERNAT